MCRTLSPTALAVPALALFALTTVGALAQGPSLQGRIDGDKYIAPSGAYSVAIPVIRELGGTIIDSANVVTFQDEFSTLISVAAFPQDATQRWELSTRGTKDYLIYFFESFVMNDFRKAFPATTAEPSARYVPTLFDGSLITFALLPGGSMFADHTFNFQNDAHSLVAKRGNLLFVKNGYTYVISMELAERVTEPTKFNKSSDEEDIILRERLTSFAAKLHFASAPTAAPGAAPAAH